MPVAIVLAITAIWYIWESGNTVLYDSFAQKMFGGLENYGLLAIPLFMLTGELMNEGGMTRRLVALARVFVGGFRGGLAYINLLANMFMAAIIGSATAQIAVMSRAMVPAMKEEGYDKGFAAATTAAGGLLAPVIPPSMMFVIFGVLAQIPIGDMFIAGILPGFILAASFALVITLIGWRQQFPKGNWMTRSETIKAVISAAPALLIPMSIIGGILFGIATPTESAAIASLIAFLVGWLVYGDLKPGSLAQMFKRTAANASMILFMISAASVFGWVIIYEEIPQQLAGLITSVTSDPFVFLLIVNLALLLVGMVIDGIASDYPDHSDPAANCNRFIRYQPLSIWHCCLPEPCAWADDTPGRDRIVHRLIHERHIARLNPEIALAIPDRGNFGFASAQLFSKPVNAADLIWIRFPVVIS